MTITGSAFHPSKTLTTVEVGGAQCKITSITSTEIKCITSKDTSDSSGFFVGNAGLRRQLWLGEKNFNKMDEYLAEDTFVAPDID